MRSGRARSFNRERKRSLCSRSTPRSKSPAASTASTPARTGKAYVIDYKYSAAQRTKGRLKDENLLQAPLYYLAAKEAFGVEPDGVFYVGLKKGVEYVGWSHSGFLGSNPIPEDWLEKARARTLQAALEIRGGRVEVAPSNPGNCRFCDCRDVCRVTTRITVRATAWSGNGRGAGGRMSATRFTAAQLEAIDISKSHLDTCVVAGPGSGKTTVLVEYFARLVAAGVDPLRILAITFTEKAAANMRAKLAAQFEGETGVRAQFERAWVFTIHGFCARLLREQAVWAGVDPEFTIADEHDALRMQQESLGRGDGGGVRARCRSRARPDSRPILPRFRRARPLRL